MTGTESPNNVVRVAEPGDVEIAAAVSREAFERLRLVYRPTGAAAVLQADRANEGTRLVAEIDNRIVGTVQFDVHRLHVHLIGLAVQPEFQRRGVARNMIE